MTVERWGDTAKLVGRNWMRCLLSVLGVSELVMAAGGRPYVLGVGIVGGICLLTAAWLRTPHRLLVGALVALGTVPFAALAWRGIVPVILLLSAIAVATPIIGSSPAADHSLPARARAHLVNPVLRVLLRSPLYGLFSGSMLLLDYTGRRPGQRYTLPVMYAVMGGDLVVVAGQHESKTWWRNFGSEPVEVTVRLAGRPAGATARRPAPGPLEERSASLAYRERFPRAPVESAAPVVVIRPVKQLFSLSGRQIEAREMDHPSGVPTKAHRKEQLAHRADSAADIS